MSIALELRGIRKRFVVGAGECRAAAEVLRGVDLVVGCGECVVIAGAIGSGKSTLMLCAAGLLTPDAGELTWFGSASRAVTRRRVLYHHVRADLVRAGCADEAHLHLVDIAALPNDAALAAWIEQRRARGDTVVMTTRDATSISLPGARVHALRAGRVQCAGSAMPAHARVAETTRL